MTRYRGWVGGGWGEWVAGGGLYLPLGTDNSVVSSFSDKNRLNPQSKSRQSLAAVWHTLSNSVHWWFDWVGKIPSVKAHLAIYSHVWCFWEVHEFRFNVQH